MTTAQPFPPEPDSLLPEPLQRIGVACDPVVCEVAPKLLTQGPVLFGEGAMAFLAEPLPQLRSRRLSRLLDVFRFTTQRPL